MALQILHMCNRRCGLTFDFKVKEVKPDVPDVSIRYPLAVLHSKVLISWYKQESLTTFNIVVRTMKSP